MNMFPPYSLNYKEQMKIVDEVGNVQQKRKKDEDNTCYSDHCIIF